MVSYIPYMNGWFLMAKYGFHVGKYTSPMDCMGKGWKEKNGQLHI